MPKSPAPTPVTPPAPGDRIAKVLARSGVASRRAAEAMIAEGRVSVNGKTIDSPALNVGPRDKVTVDGKPLAKPEPIRVWIYNKPLGLVTSDRDEKGRATVFDALPEGMPRVMSIGRLDLNSEGLLLLTNDGGLKRRLELPSTGWLRKYRVRVNGTPTEAMVEPLRKGITLDGERFQPMMVTIDKQQGANAWLTVGIREGKNREIRRAMDAVGLAVNRLIRTAYGPFQLGNLASGAIEELRPRTLRDQLGLKVDEVAEGRAAPLPQGETAAPRAAAVKGPGKPAGKATTDRAQPGKTPGGKPASGKLPPRASAAPDDKPGRKSWGAKSHGGGRAAADGTPAKPKSWGSKSARSTATVPRKPGTPR
ncbi:MAG: pseudouridine synthase [Rhodobacteraceae bacterium]|jgi:23S rRNA pseudouridine2605 synthase|nr:pseudouridine synthase [Paracoccaceae bacterium]